MGAFANERARCNVAKSCEKVSRFGKIAIIIYLHILRFLDKYIFLVTDFYSTKLFFDVQGGPDYMEFGVISKIIQDRR